MKRGLQLTMSTIIIVLILLVTMIAIIAFFREGLREAGGGINTAIIKSKDGLGPFGDALDDLF